MQLQNETLDKEQIIDGSSSGMRCKILSKNCIRRDADYITVLAMFKILQFCSDATSSTFFKIFADQHAFFVFLWRSVLQYSS